MSLVNPVFGPGAFPAKTSGSCKRSKSLSNFAISSSFLTIFASISFLLFSASCRAFIAA